MKLTVICVALFAFFAGSAARADEPDSRGFSVDFSQCTEFAGVGPVDFARASSLVQPSFTTLGAGSAAAIVVRATSCASAQVDGGDGVPTIISQIGIEIVPPDGTGDINNYTLTYVTNNAQLALAFRRVCLPVIFDPTITYEFTYDSTGKSGELYVEAEGAGLPAYFLTGAETDPNGGGSDFKANWWYKGFAGVIKQASDFPNISFGPANVSLHASRESALGKLIGGNTDTDFHFFPVRGIYPAAHMDVTTSSQQAAGDASEASLSATAADPRTSVLMAAACNRTTSEKKTAN